MAVYHRDGLLWRLPRLPPEWRRMKKSTDSICADKVRVERRALARLGVLAQWYQPGGKYVDTTSYSDR